MRTLNSIDTENIIDFVIIGSAKCGTTSLNQYLANHSEIHMIQDLGINNETALFLDFNGESIKGITNRRLRKYRSRDYILSRIKKVPRDEKLIGIESTDYTKKPFRSVRYDLMARFTKRPKFIYITRDPQYKIISQFEHFRRFRPNFTNKDFIREITSEEYYRYSTSYFYQIRPYIKYFGIDSIYITCLELLKKQPLEILNEIASFLGIKNFELEETTSKIYNASPTKIFNQNYNIPESLKICIQKDAINLNNVANFNPFELWPSIND